MSFYYDYNDNDEEYKFDYKRLTFKNYLSGAKEENKKVSRNYNEIVDLYDNKELQKMIAEKEKKIREILLKDTAIESIVNLLRSREEELGLKKDTLVNGFYNNDTLMKMVPDEVKKLWDKELECFKENVKKHNEKMKEIRAILKMTETWAEMKEVLIRYEIINWTDWDEK